MRADISVLHKEKTTAGQFCQQAGTRALCLKLGAKSVSAKNRVGNQFLRRVKSVISQMKTNM